MRGQPLCLIRKAVPSSGFWDVHIVVFNRVFFWCVGFSKKVLRWIDVMYRCNRVDTIDRLGKYITSSVKDRISVQERGLHFLISCKNEKITCSK